MTLTRVTRVVAALVLLPSFVACRRAANDGGAPAGDRAQVVAALDRGPCYGRCPEYALALYSDGRVQFDGRRNVQATGAHTRTVKAAAVQALLTQYGPPIGALRDSTWAPGAPTCPQVATDLPTLLVSVRIADRLRTFTVYQGCPNAPAVLKDFARALDSVALSPDWLIR